MNFEGIRSAKGGDIRAAYRQHQWSVDGLSYFRLDCTPNVGMHFEAGPERSRRYGPYARFSAINGLACGDDKVIAFLDFKSARWLFYDSGHHWPVMVVRDAN